MSEHAACHSVRAVEWVVDLPQHGLGGAGGPGLSAMEPFSHGVRAEAPVRLGRAVRIEVPSRAARHVPTPCKGIRVGCCCCSMSLGDMRPAWGQG